MNADSPTDLESDSQGRTSPLIERAPLPMVEVEGTRHVICSVNAAFCRLLHKSREDLIGKPFGQIVRNGEKCEALLDRVYETGESEIHLDSDQGSVNPSHWIYAMWPALDAHEKPERVVIQLTKSAHFQRDVAAINEALLISRTTPARASRGCGETKHAFPRRNRGSTRFL
jgi:hypothetical protein